MRIVFKHRPLSIHPWARRAALAGICAGAQGDAAFWRIERFFFGSQSTITSDNLQAKVRGFASGGGVTDADQMQTCLDSGYAEQMLARDEQLAELYHVDATPTVFINGVRKVGFASPEELRVALIFAAAHPLSATTH
jgi:NhaA family Na+:H+ antiporter